MTIETLAAKYKLRTTRGECDEVIIPGKLGHLFIYSDTHVGAMYMPSDASKGWKARREALAKAGATVIQNGDTEGTVTFPADNKAILKAACKALGIYRKRTVAPEVMAKRVEALRKARSLKKTVVKNSL